MSAIDALQSDSLRKSPNTLQGARNSSLVYCIGDGLDCEVGEEAQVCFRLQKLDNLLLFQLNLLDSSFKMWRERTNRSQKYLLEMFRCEYGSTFLTRIEQQLAERRQKQKYLI